MNLCLIQLMAAKQVGFFIALSSSSLEKFKAFEVPV